MNRLQHGERVSIGIIGCGHWGPNHIRAFLSLPGVSVSWAVDQSKDRCRSIAVSFRHVRVTTDVQEVLNDGGVNAVVIATPAETHCELAIRAIEAGKHVLCEKPLALSSAECEKLIVAAAARGVVLMVGHVFLFNTGILKLKEIIDSDGLGNLYYGSAIRTNLGPIRSDTNVSYDLASHEISIFNFLLGSTPLIVSARGQAFLKPGIEDVAFITLTYPKSIIAGITVSWLNPQKVREITLVGDKKMVVWNDLALSPVAIHDKGTAQEPFYDSYGEFQLLAREGDVTIPKIHTEEPLKRQARFFIEAIKTGTATLCSGKCGLAVIRTLEAINESMLRGGSPVAIESNRIGEGRKTL
ncbi:Gfo/Idh/MocA family oxidoreductase [Candidatus Methylomirabilis sp.]|uniref:Gfo/Idh/MocA family protein n=1 Tax=Candidatus Methylomirabilis sp. TaxID=2032687 RepID=UPI002A652D9E|nr:Gfo/Idh/MocA family oxidoreductase [Candidatus Methylomirabilis sp.]